MKYLSDRYVSVYNHKDFDICTLKTVVPENGDELGYVIDSEVFEGQVFNDIAAAIEAIEEQKEDTIIVFHDDDTLMPGELDEGDTYKGGLIYEGEEEEAEKKD